MACTEYTIAQPSCHTSTVSVTPYTRTLPPPPPSKLASLLFHSLSDSFGRFLGRLALALASIFFNVCHAVTLIPTFYGEMLRGRGVRFSPLPFSTVACSNIYWRPLHYSLPRLFLHDSVAFQTSWARICKPFKEPRNRFLAWWAGMTTLFVVPARHAT